MTSLHELRELPNEGDYFLSFDDLLKVIRNASIKYKFSFRTLYKDPKRAQYRCTNKDCPWKINTHVDTVFSIHTCISDTTAKGEAASCQGWVQKVIARHMDIKPNTPIEEIQSMLRVLFAENISYKNCQLARLSSSYGRACRRWRR